MMTGHLKGRSCRQNAVKHGAVNKLIAVRGHASKRGESRGADPEGVTALEAHAIANLRAKTISKF